MQTRKTFILNTAIFEKHFLLWAIGNILAT